MKRDLEPRSITEAFAEATGLSPVMLPSQPGVDLLLEAGGYRFVFGVKAYASTQAVGTAIQALQRYAADDPAAVPVVTVPFMGEVGKGLCAAAGVQWLDLSGNARIAVSGLRVNIQGKANRFAQAGRPRDLFATKSSRLARTLLLHADRVFSQRELAGLSGLGPGHVSRLVKGYAAAGLVDLQGDRPMQVRLKTPDLLLDLWRSSYDFGVHQVEPGHVPARSGRELLQRVSHELASHGVLHAATGLGAAWLQAPFANFRLVTVYIAQWPSEDVLERLSWREDAQGANLWLVRPKDDDALRGGGITDGIQHVSAVQTYLDLKAQPERSEEAAEALRAACLKWS
jgi:hypothetical protein